MAFEPPIPRACVSCGRRVYWAMTVNDQRMPVDAEAVPDGNMVMAVDGKTGALKVYALADDAVVDPARRRYVSHFATCPHANRWRKGRS